MQRETDIFGLQGHSKPWPFSLLPRYPFGPSPNLSSQQKTMEITTNGCLQNEDRRSKIEEHKTKTWLILGLLSYPSLKGQGTRNRWGLRLQQGPPQTTKRRPSRIVQIKIKKWNHMKLMMVADEIVGNSWVHYYSINWKRVVVLWIPLWATLIPESASSLGQK